MQADIYVNSVGDNLDLSSGAVSQSLLRAGGQALKNQCAAYIASNGNVRIGGAVVTGPGSIRCKKIIHTVGAIYDGRRSEQVI